ncbi:glycosyltransferase [Patescibacteria group bacterium]|nr:glycosyltransferase [Patescibacteria group bacterium]
MKIAFIVDSFPALSETFILNQITGLIDRGHNVAIFPNNKREDPKVHPDVKSYDLLSRTYYRHMPTNRIWRICKAFKLLLTNLYKSPITILRSLNVIKYGKEALSLKLFYALLPFLGKGPYDLVHCHFGPNGIIGAFLKEVGINTNLITTFHGYDMSMFILNQGEDIYKNLFSLGDLFMPISEHWGGKLVEMGCDDGKIIVHRMGIDLDNFMYSEKKPAETVIILSVGRLVEKKGHKYVIQAIARIVKKNKNIEYIIAGDGPLRGALEDLVSKLGVGKYVKFLGAVEQNEVLNLYRKSHIFVLHSVTAYNGDQEGIPVVLMEAQAVGLPAISTFHSGIPEIVLDDKTGFLVPERDVDALAEKLQYLIEHPEIWPEMGKCGRRFVEEKYDIEKLNQRLVEIYQNLIKGKYE